MRYNCNMLENLENIVVKDILSTKDIEDVFYYVDNTKQCSPEVHPEIGYSWHPCGVPQNIHNKIESYVQKNILKDARLTEICVARYRFSENMNPILLPHMDNFSSSKLTVDIQLKSNTDWALLVKGKRFVLADGEALIFAGTHQPHWREPKQFNEGDYVEMLFCHFTVDAEPTLSEEEFTNLEKIWNEKYGN